MRLILSTRFESKLLYMLPNMMSLLLSSKLGVRRKIGALELISRGPSGTGGPGFLDTLAGRGALLREQARHVYVHEPLAHPEGLTGIDLDAAQQPLVGRWRSACPRPVGVADKCPEKRLHTVLRAKNLGARAKKSRA